MVSDNPTCPNSEFTVSVLSGPNEISMENLPEFITFNVQAQITIITEELADIGIYVLEVTETDLGNDY